MFDCAVFEFHVYGFNSNIGKFCTIWLPLLSCNVKYNELFNNVVPALVANSLHTFVAFVNGEYVLTEIDIPTIFLSRKNGWSGNGNTNCVLAVLAGIKISICTKFFTVVLLSCIGANLRKKGRPNKAGGLYFSIRKLV